MKAEHSILSLCEHLEVSSSGYYDWQKRRLCPGPRALEDQALVEEIDRIHVESRKTYGSPRVVQELRKQGRRHGRNRISWLVNQKGLCGRQKGRYRVRTTDSNTMSPSPPTAWPRLPEPRRPIRFGCPE